MLLVHRIFTADEITQNNFLVNIFIEFKLGTTIKETELIGAEILTLWKRKQNENCR